MVIIDDNNICRLIKWESIQTITNTKTMKMKGFPRYTKINKKYGKIGFNFILNTKHENQNKNMKYVRQKCKWNFIIMSYEITNTKWNKQKYDAISYLELVLNKLKIMEGFIFIFIPLGTKLPYAHCPRNFIKNLSKI